MGLVVSSALFACGSMLANNREESEKKRGKLQAARLTSFLLHTAAIGLITAWFFSAHSSE